MAYFFRDPERIAPADDSIVLSPADGRVTRVEKAEAGNPQSPTVISIFLSPFDVHINRSPIAGEVVNVTYTKGRFLIATNEEASVVNEQNSLTIRGEEMTVVCKQIAGVLARRIVCWKNVGDRVGIGERFGLIKFSSRTDLIVPPEVDVLLKVGERVRGGLSVVGRLRNGR
jgi:phosphatidylserine decarboxylase